MDVADGLVSLIKQNQNIAIHFGVVSQLNVSPASLSVKIAGSTTPTTLVRYLASYSPTLNDVVLVLVNKGDVIVLGKLA